MSLWGFFILGETCCYKPNWQSHKAMHCHSKPLRNGQRSKINRRCIHLTCPTCKCNIQPGCVQFVNRLCTVHEKSSLPSLWATPARRDPSLYQNHHLFTWGACRCCYDRNLGMKIYLCKYLFLNYYFCKLCIVTCPCCLSSVPALQPDSSLSCFITTDSFLCRYCGFISTPSLRYFLWLNLILI